MLAKGNYHVADQKAPMHYKVHFDPQEQHFYHLGSVA